jgi:hypothetical protein
VSHPVVTGHELLVVDQVVVSNQTVHSVTVRKMFDEINRSIHGNRMEALVRVENVTTDHDKVDRVVFQNLVKGFFELIDLLDVIRTDVWVADEKNPHGFVFYGTANAYFSDFFIERIVNDRSEFFDSQQRWSAVLGTSR